MAIYNSITELVGNTPLLRLNGYEKHEALAAGVYAKLEFFNPNQSVKDRIALGMIEDAEEKGLLKPGGTIVETTSGNTGIALAAIASAKGYKFRVYIQDQVSQERFQVIRAFGAELIPMSEEPVLDQVLKDTDGDFVAAVKALEEKVRREEPDVFFANQVSNPANPATHRRNTGPEIWEETDGKVDILVATVGTGGTLSGAGNYLKQKNPDIQIIGVQPGPNSLPSEENPEPEEITGVHPFTGIPDERIPGAFDRAVYTDVVEVETHDAYQAARRVAQTDGILVGTSSGAALYAARQVARKSDNHGKHIVVILPDTGLRYLSTALFA